MPDVYFYEAFEEEADEIRKILPDRIRAGYSSRTIQESGHDTPPAGLVSIRTQSEIPDAWATQVAGILTRSTGYDHLLDYRTRTSFLKPCGYLPLYCARAVAEQALLLWMALIRKLDLQRNRFAQFHRDGLTGSECLGKCLAVAGVGHIGYEITRIGQGLDMKVLGVDPVRRHGTIEYAEPGVAFGQADLIVCSMNLTASNAGYFDYARWRTVKPGAVFINIARGELAPSADLVRALEEQLLDGVGLDVYNHESLLATSLRNNRAVTDDEVMATLKLHKHPRAILTPHNAFNTAEALARKTGQSVQQVEHFLSAGSFLWPVPEG